MAKAQKAYRQALVVALDDSTNYKNKVKRLKNQIADLQKQIREGHNERYKLRHEYEVKLAADHRDAEAWRAATKSGLQFVTPNLAEVAKTAKGTRQFKFRARPVGVSTFVDITVETPLTIRYQNGLPD